MGAGRHIPRVFLSQPLYFGRTVTFSDKSEHRGRNLVHHLKTVLRLREGSRLRCFNGHEGEWIARVERVTKHELHLTIQEQQRTQPPAPTQALALFFSPIKCLTSLLKHCTQLGVQHFFPVVTKHTTGYRASHFNSQRLESIILEAVEQCGRLDVPSLSSPQTLPELLKGWDDEFQRQRHSPESQDSLVKFNRGNYKNLLVCDEHSKDSPSLYHYLNKVEPIQQQDLLGGSQTTTACNLAVMVGPEGGFTEEERSLLKDRAYITRVSLGDNTLQSDTAAIASCALLYLLRREKS